MRGTCLCGKIEFQVSDMGPGIYQCHCSLCRKQGGSASNSASLVQRDRFSWISGEQLVSSWVKDNGFRSDFCSCCGSPVPNPVGNSDLYWIPMGLVEQGAFEIRAHLFVDSKASWERISSSGDQYRTMPDLDELLAILADNGHG